MEINSATFVAFVPAAETDKMKRLVKLDGESENWR